MLRALFAVGLVAFLALPQDKPSPCDVGRVEDGQYCVKCSKVVTKTDKTTDFDKDGNCKNCGQKPEAAKVCVKDWIPRCGMHDMRSHERDCCNSKFCCRHELVYSLIVQRCKGCGGETRDAAKPACKPGCKAAEYEPVCSKSGVAPHGADCDVKTVEAGHYCFDKNCRKLLDKTEMDKDGKCISCKRKSDIVKVCAKTDDGKSYRARIAIGCRVCKSEGKEGENCPTKTCSRVGKAFELVCTDSGCWPHGGAPPKKEK